MASIYCTYFSRILEKEMDAYVFLPSFTQEDKETPEELKFSTKRKFKTLVLLHGFSGTHSSWHRNTRMESYAEKKGLAVICPDGNNGHYTDWENGPQYLTHLNDEFLPAMQAMFPLSKNLEDNFVGGYSMGGYGAAKWAFRYPGRFSHLISFSGGLDIMPRIEHYKQHLGVKASEMVFGKLEEIEQSKHNIFQLMEDYNRNNEKLLSIYSCSGTEDLPAMHAHLMFIKLAAEHGHEVTSFEGPGKHDFDFWDQELKKVICDWLPLKS